MINLSPKLTIIMCTYNRKEFLTRSIESILSQTFKNYEFILIDNGSTDGSYEICEKYAKEDNRIKLIKVSQNQGAAYGRNIGLDAASAEYLTIVDDDDYCEPQMIEFLWNLLTKYNADISICGSWNDINGLQEPYFIYDDCLILDKVQGLDELLKRNRYNVAPPTKLFRKSLFKNIRFKENVLIDDIHVIYKIFANANIVVAQGKPFYSFRKHNGNMTNFIQSNHLSPALLNEYLSAFRYRSEYLSNKVPEISTRVRYSEWSYMISMSEKIKSYNIKDCIKVYDSMVEILKNDYVDVISCNFVTDKEKSILNELIM
jgi:glycosyltransferase involved in cell wall biosynthesis